MAFLAGSSELRPSVRESRFNLPLDDELAKFGAVLSVFSARLIEKLGGAPDVRVLAAMKELEAERLAGI